MKYRIIFVFIVGLIIGSSCQPKKSKYINWRKLEPVDLTITRFEKDFNALKSGDIEAQKQHLEQQYPILYPIYNQGIIRIGDHRDQGYNALALKFLTDSIYIEVYDTVMQHFATMEKYEKAFSEAFSRYHALFPQNEIPQLYTHISGFNEPIVVADKTLSVSLESYLGEAHVFYKRLGTYAYQLKHKNPDHIVGDAMRGWLFTEWEVPAHATLLDRMIYEGKIIFVLTQILPETSVSSLIGISDEQLQWCERYQSDTWKFMIEQKHLFTNRNSIIAKYLQDGPFFNFVGSGSSPMVAKHMGWKIVKSYMANNAQLDIRDLMNETSAQALLENSKFNP